MRPARAPWYPRGMRRLSYALIMGLCLIAAPAVAQDAGTDAANEVDATVAEEAGEDAADDAAPAEDDAGGEAGPDDTCFSPTQNVDKAYDEDAVGCPCDEEVAEDVCVDGAALTCEEGAWTAVVDGPCWPAPPDPDPIPLCSASAPGNASSNVPGSLLLAMMMGVLAGSRRRSRGL